MKAGIAITAVYLICVIAGPYYFGLAPNTLNEWGDYFAGFMAPVALGWFVVTLLMQRRELQLQRDELQLQRQEMELTRDVLKEQGEQQLRTAEATLEANKISASDSFADRVPQYHTHLGSILDRLAIGIPSKTEKPGSVTLMHGTPTGDPTSFLAFMRSLQSHGYDPSLYLHASQRIAIIGEYLTLFSEFKRKALETNNSVFLIGPWEELAIELESIISRYSDDEDEGAD